MNPLHKLGLMLASLLGVLMYIGYLEWGLPFGPAMGAVLFVLFAVYSVWKFMNRCDCNRRRKWFFEPGHPKPRVMLVQMAWFGGWAGWDLLTGEWVSAIMMGVPTLWHLGWMYYHEKDRLKKAVEKAVGVVRMNMHGRLVVAPA